MRLAKQATALLRQARCRDRATDRIGYIGPRCVVCAHPVAVEDRQERGLRVLLHGVCLRCFEPSVATAEMTLSQTARKSTGRSTLPLVEDGTESPARRRKPVLKMAPVIVSAALLAACGGEDQGAATSPSTPAAGAVPQAGTARAQLERRLPGGTGERSIVSITRDLVILADTDPDPSEIAVKSIIRSYVRSGFKRPLSIRFDGATFQLTGSQVASFEDEDRADAVDVELYRLRP